MQKIRCEWLAILVKSMRQVLSYHKALLARKAPLSEDIFIACVGGLKSFPEAIKAIYPQHAGAELPLRIW